MTKDDLILLPRPSLMAFLAGKYEVDPVQTKTHYDQLFAGSTATQVLELLKEAEIHAGFASADTVTFIVRDNGGPIVFKGLISLRFEAGLFQEAKVLGGGFG